MKIQITLILVLISLCWNTRIISQQKHLEVEGEVKFRGNLDIHDFDDSTSVYIGLHTGEIVNNDSVLINGTFNRQNTFVGSFAGQNTTTGHFNTMFGEFAGHLNTSGYSNAFLGRGSGDSNTTGRKNTFVGANSGQQNTIGSDNSYFGNSPFHNNPRGNRNTYLGTNSGASAGVDSIDQSIAIGYMAKVNCTKCAVIGGTNVDAVKVGIGTDSPEETLDVRGELLVKEEDGVAFFQSSTSNSFISLQNNDGIAGGTNVGYFDNGPDNYFYVDIPGGVFPEFTILSNGNVGIGKLNPGHPLEMASGARVTSGGVWTNASSRSLKENINNLTAAEAIANLMNLNPVKFNYKLQKNEEYIGFIAEDVPELVATLDRKSLSPMDIVALLTKVVQSQHQKIDLLEEQISELNILKLEISELKKMIKAEPEK